MTGTGFGVAWWGRVVSIKGGRRRTRKQKERKKAKKEERENWKLPKGEEGWLAKIEVLGRFPWQLSNFCLVLYGGSSFFCFSSNFRSNFPLVCSTTRQPTTECPLGRSFSSILCFLGARNANRVMEFAIRTDDLPRTTTRTTQQSTSAPNQRSHSNRQTLTEEEKKAANWFASLCCWNRKHSGLLLCWGCCLVPLLVFDRHCVRGCQSTVSYVFIAYIQLSFIRKTWSFRVDLFLLGFSNAIHHSLVCENLYEHFNGWSFFAASGSSISFSQSDNDEPLPPSKADTCTHTHTHMCVNTLASLIRHSNPKLACFRQICRITQQKAFDYPGVCWRRRGGGVKVVFISFVDHFSLRDRKQEKTFRIIF